MAPNRNQPLTRAAAAAAAWKEQTQQTHEETTITEPADPPEPPRENNQDGQGDIVPHDVEDELQQELLKEARLIKQQQLQEARNRNATRQAQMSQRGDQDADHLSPPEHNANRPPTPTSTASSTTSGKPNRTPPDPAHIKPFAGTGLKEYDSFMNRLRIHFQQHAWYYQDDSTRKAVCGASNLDEGLLNQWSRETERLETLRTWDEFQSFCLATIRPPELLQQDVGIRFDRATQRENQSVAEFVNYLHAIEDQLPDKYTDTQRKRHLYSKLHEEVRRETQRMSSEPESYTEYVKYVEGVEDRMRDRTSKLRAYKNQRGRPALTVRNAPKGTWRDAPYKRKRSPPNQHRDSPSCYKCGRLGHIALHCRSRPQNQNPNTISQAKN